MKCNLIWPMMNFSGHHDVYRICAVSEEERETWIGCVKWVEPNCGTNNYCSCHGCECSLLLAILGYFLCCSKNQLMWNTVRGFLICPVIVGVGVIIWWSRANVSTTPFAWPVQLRDFICPPPNSVNGYGHLAPWTSCSQSFCLNQESVHSTIILNSLHFIQKLLCSTWEISEIYTFINFVYIVKWSNFCMARSDFHYGANWLLVGMMLLGAKWPWGEVPRYQFVICNVENCNDGLPG